MFIWTESLHVNNFSFKNTTAEINIKITIKKSVIHFKKVASKKQKICQAHRYLTIPLYLQSYHKHIPGL